MTVSITTINASDQISASRADINTNFSNLNSGKIDQADLDTTVTLGTSDVKVPSQLATKTYIDNQTVSVSAKTKITVVYGQLIAVGDALYIKASDQKAWKTDSDDVNTTNAFIGFALEAGNADESKLVQLNGIVTGLSGLTAGADYYIGSTVGAIQTTAGTNALKVGIALSTTTLLINKTAHQHPKITTYLTAASPATWTKPIGLKYIEVELVAGGGGGGGSSGVETLGAGGGGGGYSKKIIQASALGATETVTIGAGGAGGVGANPGATGATTSFGSHLSATGGTGGDDSTGYNPGAGGSGSGGDLNISGMSGGLGLLSSVVINSGIGGNSILGFGAPAVWATQVGGQSYNGNGGSLYGGGGSGAVQDGTGAQNGGVGAAGIVIVKEYF